jgi:hypothetical protein
MKKTQNHSFGRHTGGQNIPMGDSPFKQKDGMEKCGKCGCKPCKCSKSEERGEKKEMKEEKDC